MSRFDLQIALVISNLLANPTENFFNQKGSSKAIELFCAWQEISGVDPTLFARVCGFSVAENITVIPK
jgi:hypothetical protein